MSILVTGATGFVGKCLVEELLKQKLSVSAVVRINEAFLPNGAIKVCIPDLTVKSDWQPILKNINVVVHVAAWAHIMNDVANPLAEFRKVNRDATLHLARQAAKANVKRFVFLSSIKVNGEMTGGDIHPNPLPKGEGIKDCFTEDDMFVPDDPYGLSKYEAEQGLLAIAKETCMEVVIIRSPLIYGPNVQANFASMIKWINKIVPLPFGAIHNQRSLVALDNLVSFIIHCIDHPKAANEIFLISDGEDVSTTELLQKVAKALGKKSLLLPVPVSWMIFAAKLIGKEAVANRLFGSLQVDSSKARDLLGWKPVITMDEQLKKMADAD